MVTTGVVSAWVFIADFNTDITFLAVPINTGTGVSFAVVGTGGKGWACVFVQTLIFVAVFDTNFVDHAVTFDTTTSVFTRGLITRVFIATGVTG